MKRSFDLIVAVLGLFILAPLLAMAAIAVAIETRSWPIFTQERVGRRGELFTVMKFRTMVSESTPTSVTTSDDPRITPIGRLLRRSKLDEIPQLWNVIVGDMSLVGPRPDVPGYADRLTGRNRAILEVRPGITSPAAVLLRDEEQLLSHVAHPEWFNDEILYPVKAQLNLNYVRDRTFWGDVEVLLRTLIPLRFQRDAQAQARDLRERLLAMEAAVNGDGIQPS